MTVTETVRSVRERIEDGHFREEPASKFKTAEESELEIEAYAAKEEIDKARERLQAIQQRQREAKRQSAEACNRHNAGILAVFKHAALAEVGLIDHPKAEKAWSTAWDRGHSNGYHDVLSALEEIAELLKD